MKNYNAIEGMITESQSILQNRLYVAFDKGYEQGFKAGYEKRIADAKDACESAENEAYQRGLDDTWEAARKICVHMLSGGLSYDTMDSIFGTCSFEEISRINTASEAIKKIRQYEEQKKAEEEEKELCEEAKQKVEALAEDIGLDQMMDILKQLQEGERCRE